MVVLLTDPAGNAVDVAGVQATLALPEAGITGIPVSFQRLEAGHHHSRAQFPQAGRWELSVTLQISAVASQTVTAPIVIGGA